MIEIAPDRVSNGAVFTLVQNGVSGTAGLGTAESSNQLFGLDTGYRQNLRHRDLRLQQERSADAALSQTDVSIRSLINAYATNKTDPGVFDVSWDDSADFVSRAVSPGSAVLTVSGTRYNVHGESVKPVAFHGIFSGDSGGGVMLNFDELRSRLPIANAGFSFLRERALRYVDKTGFVYKLALDNQPRILTRPRRFGKSTLLSTVEELFLHGLEPCDGHDSYFKGLSIEKTWQDHGNYPVLHLDFYGLNLQCPDFETFERKVNAALDEFADARGLKITTSFQDFSAHFGVLLKQLPDYSLVLLVDEFDSPLVHRLREPEELQKASAFMQGLFGMVKQYTGKFRCVFFTGITRFQDLGLGTAGNGFTDISMVPSFAACCGYTREELKHCFAGHLRYAAAVRLGIRDEEVTEEQTEALLDEMSSWYDGYSFDGRQKSRVFSTWSVLRFFADEEAVLQPYWSSEEGLGLPQLLKLSLDRINAGELLKEVSSGELEVSARQFIQSSLINPRANPYSLMFQTGYLTLKTPFTLSGTLHLDCPNKEISMAFANLVGLSLFRKEEDRFTENYSEKTVAVLKSLEPEKLRAYFNDLFAALPYEHYPVASEATVAALIDFNLRGAGLKPRPQQLSSMGRADTVLDLPQDNLTLVFEYKYEESADEKKLDARLEEAVTQVRERKYGLNDGSLDRVVRFAMVFCAAREKRCLERLELVDVQQRQLT